MPLGSRPSISPANHWAASFASAAVARNIGSSQEGCQMTPPFSQHIGAEAQKPQTVGLDTPVANTTGTPASSSFRIANTASVEGVSIP